MSFWDIIDKNATGAGLLVLVAIITIGVVLVEWARAYGRRKP